MKRIQIFLALALSAAIILTSGSMAVARGQVMVAGKLVICTGSAPKVIRVDSNNQPVGPAHYCPECVLSIFDLPDVEDDWSAHPVGYEAVVQVFSPVVAKSRPLILIGARGPPHSVSTG